VQILLLSADAIPALVQPFVHCRLDYCNALLTGAADVHFKRIQSVQNAAARLVSAARRHDHIAPVLTTLYWLPVSKRVMFKTAVLVWKCLLNSTAPSYLNYLWTKCNISRHFLKTLLQLLYPSLMTKLSCQLHHICKYMWHMQPTACDAQLAEQRKMTYKPSKLDQSDLVFSLWSEFVSRSVRDNGYGLWHVENVYVWSVGPQRRVSER